MCDGPGGLRARQRGAWRWCLIGEFMVADGGAGGEHEAVAGLVGESGAVEAVDRVDGVESWPYSRVISAVAQGRWVPSSIRRSRISQSSRASSAAWSGVGCSSGMGEHALLCLGLGVGHRFVLGPSCLGGLPEARAAWCEPSSCGPRGRRR